MSNPPILGPGGLPAALREIVERDQKEYDEYQKEQGYPTVDEHVPSKELDEEINDLPITHFCCHLFDRERARKHLEKMAKTNYDPEIRQMMMEIPLQTMKGIKKNYILAMSGDTRVFWVNIKNGQMEQL